MTNGRALAGLMTYPEDMMCCRFGRTRLVNARCVMEHDLRGFDESNLLQRIVEDLELFNGQVPVDFDYYAFHSDASGRARSHVNH